jgi:hypothetical protein
MELWLLGAGAIVLIAITLWLVWPASIRGEEDRRMIPPQGDEFEDQYTSATADLSAGGVAAALNTSDEATEASDAPSPTPYAAAGEPWSSPTMAREGGRIWPTPTSTQTEPRSDWSAQPMASPRAIISLGAAALCVILGAVLGAWVYARWQRRRNQPINRLRRTLREAQGQLRR